MISCFGGSEMEITWFKFWTEKMTLAAVLWMGRMCCARVCQWELLALMAEANQASPQALCWRGQHITDSYADPPRTKKCQEVGRSLLEGAESSRGNAAAGMPWTSHPKAAPAVILLALMKHVPAANMPIGFCWLLPNKRDCCIHRGKDLLTRRPKAAFCSCLYMQKYFLFFFTALMRLCQSSGSASGLESLFLGVLG